jgi:hypothetical protein
MAHLNSQEIGLRSPFSSVFRTDFLYIIRISLRVLSAHPHLITDILVFRYSMDSVVDIY